MTKKMCAILLTVALLATLMAPAWAAAERHGEGDRQGNHHGSGSYAVTFDAKGGSAVADQTVDRGGLVVKPADPTREGYTFLGWYYCCSYYTLLYNFDHMKVYWDLTLTAKWKPVNADPDPKTGPKQDGKTGFKPGAKPDLKQGGKPEAKPNLKPETKPAVAAVTPSATVEKLNGNKNNLTITLTETAANGAKKEIAQKTFSINNNAADTYEVGDYKVYVDTKGNTQIRACYLVE